ncbi:MAG: hypothetical protein Q4Q06_00080 [Bacteroidota bacterium]|nr:hypothetical protein [Bacteroidota bacterium]
MLRRCLLNCFLSLLSLYAYAQGLTCYNIQEALQNKDSVTTLILKKQNLKEFPLEILSLSNLQRLDISRNYIDHIPKEIAELKQLHYLNAAQNMLSYLPKELASLPLDTLILWDNSIREFDESYKNTNLKYLDIRAIQMTRSEQKAIKKLFPKARIRKDHPCNCGSRK